jgi:hypothetical protein
MNAFQKQKTGSLPLILNFYVYILPMIGTPYAKRERQATKNSLRRTPKLFISR